MSDSNKLPANPNWSHLAGLGLEGIATYFTVNPGRWILVDSAKQQLKLFRPEVENRVWPVSTALAGINGTKDSLGTPPGLHIIGRKIGNDTPEGMIFRSRKATGNIWSPQPSFDDNPSPLAVEDLILSRILTLEGLEEGLNRGKSCDSLERFIYIHGTNHETKIGSPVSHGCVRMTNTHVIELFNLVQEGDPVVIF